MRTPPILRGCLWLILALVAFASAAPAASAAPLAGCTNLQGQIVCALDVSASAGSNMSVKGTNLDTAIEMEVVFSDGTSRVYYKNAASNPAGSTVQWAVPATITRAMLDAYTGPPGYKTQAERELGMAQGQATGTGQAINIQDNAIGGKTILEIRLFDVTRSRATTSMTVSTSSGGTWVPPTLTVSTPEPNLIVVTAPSGLLSLDRFDITCSSQLNPSGCTLPAPSSTVIRANRLTGVNIGIVAGSITWTDTRASFRSNFLPGHELKVLSARKGGANGDYDLVPDLYFSPKLTSAAGTGTFRGEYKLTGGDFRLLRYAIVTLDNGTTRLVGIASGVTSDDSNPTDGVAEITLQTLSQTTLTIRDSKAVGHNIDRIDLYYRDQNLQETLVATWGTPFFVNGEITSVTSSGKATVDVAGLGFLQVVNIVFNLSDGSTLTFNSGEFDAVTNTQLTITDAQLSGVTITGATATSWDGQTMSITGLNLFVTRLGPRFDVTGPNNGDPVKPDVYWQVVALDPVVNLRCSVDGGLLGNCGEDSMATVALHGLNYGMHSVEIRGYDATGGETILPVRTFLVVRAPDIIIDNPDDGEIFVSAAGLTGTYHNAGGPITQTDCYVDNAAVACGSINLSLLAVGYHTLLIEAMGPGGEDTTQHNFRIGYPPVVDINEAATLRSDDDLSLAFTLSGDAADTVLCEVDGMAQLISPCTSPAMLTNLSPGPHTATVQASNNAGSSMDSYSFTIEQVAVVDITSPVESAVLSPAGASLAYTLNVAVDNVYCTLDGAAAPCGAASNLAFGPASLGAALASGNHTVRVEAVNSRGLRFDQATFYVPAAPAGEIISPAAGSWLRDSVGVLTDSQADSRSSVSGVRFELRPASGSWTDLATDTSAPYLYDLDTASLTDGDYELRATTTDQVGLTHTSSAVLIHVDNTDPAGEIASPADGVYRRSFVNVTSSSADAGSGVAGARFEVETSGTWTAFGTDTIAPYSVNLSSTTLADGPHGLRVVTTDKAGNTYTSATITLNVDNTNPTGELTSPGDGDIVTGTISLSANSADAGSGVNLVGFQRFNTVTSAWQTITSDSTAPYGASLDTTTLPDGDLQLRVITFDKLTNSYTSGVITARVDNTAPTGQITAPQDGSFLRGSVSVETDSADAGVGVASVLFEIDGIEFATDSAAPYKVDLDTTVLADGEHILSAVTTDLAGHATRSAAVTIHIDNTNPSGSITAPAADSINSGIIPVSSDSADASSGVASASFEISAAGAGVYSDLGSASGAPFGVSLDTVSLADGDYDVRVTTTDRAGNTYTSPARTFKVDNTEPSISITAPAHGDNLRGTLQVTADASDLTAGVNRVDFKISPSGADDFTALGSDSTDPYAATLNTTTLADGLYDLRAVAFDHGTKSGTSPTITVRVDNTLPTGSVTAPADGSLARGTISVQSDSADAGSGVASVSFEVDGSEIASDSSAPYAVDLDTTGLTDGLHALRVVTTDAAGNSRTSAAVQITVDNTDPTGAITSPAAGDYMRGAVNVTSNSADSGSGVASASFEIDGGGGFELISTDSDAPYSASLNTPTLADGSYDLRVKTVDAAGNSHTSAAVTVSVDNTLPTVSVTSPANGSFQRGAISITADASDSGSGIASVAFKVDGNAISTDSDAPYTASLDTTTLPGGNHTISAIAIDAAGNSATSSISVTIDNEAPTVSITAPMDGPHVKGAVTVTADAADAISSVTGVLFMVDGVLISSDVSSPYAADLDTAGLTDGVHTLTATATDSAGNTQTATRILRVDNLAPALSLTAPADGAYVRGNVAATATASDEHSGVVSVRFAISGGADIVDSSAPFAASFDSSQLGNGLHTVTAEATDAVGNTTTVNVAVIVDNLAPSASVTAPADGADVSGTVAVEAYADDEHSGVANVQFQTRPQGGSTWDAISSDSSSPFAASLDTAALANGTHELRVLATDGAGNVTASAVVTMNVDNLAPTGSITAPADGSFVRGIVTVSTDAADAHSGVREVELEVESGGTWTNFSTRNAAPYSATLDTTALSDGDHSLRAIVRDQVGNAHTTAVVNVTVDNTAPSGAITAPVDGSFVRGTATVTSNSADATSGVASAKFELYDGATWNLITLDSTAPYSATLNSTSLFDGTYALRVTTLDRAGNSHVSDVVSVGIDNSAPTGEITTPADGAIVKDTIMVASGSTDGFSGVASVRVDIRPVGGTFAELSSPPAAPYDTLLDTTTLADGSYQLRSVTTDNAGNSYASLIVTIQVDNTAPTGQLTAPADGSLLKGAVAVTANSADAGSGISEVRFDIREPGGTFATMVTDIVAPYSMDMETAARLDGTYELRAVTTDRAGNSVTSAIVTITTDNTAPTGQITSPADGDILRDTVQVTADSADSGSGVASVDFTLTNSGGVATRLATDTTAPYGLSLNTNTLTDGAYELRVVTTDNAGNTTTSAPSALYADNTAPFLTFNGFVETSTYTHWAGGMSTRLFYNPAPGLQSSVSFDVRLRSSDLGSGVDHVAFPQLGTGFVGGDDVTAPLASPPAAFADLYSATYFYTPGANDPTTASVVSIDGAGNPSPTRTFDVDADSLAPAGTNLTYSGGTQTTTAVNLTITPGTDAGSGLRSWTVERQVGSGGSSCIPSGAWTQVASGTNSAAASVTNTATADCQRYRLQSTDNVSNATNYVEGPIVHVDAVAPTGTLTPAPGIYAGTMAISGTVSEDVTYTVTWKRLSPSPAGPTQICTGTSTGTYACDFDTTLVMDGDYELTLSMTDAAGNANTLSRSTYVIDQSAPVIVPAPATSTGYVLIENGTQNVCYSPATASAGGTFRIAVDASDASGIDRVVFPGLTGQLGTGGVSGGGAVTTPFTGITYRSGVYSFGAGATASGTQTVEIWDNAGRLTTYTFEIEIDSNTPAMPSSVTGGDDDFSTAASKSIAVSGGDGGGGCAPDHTYQYQAKVNAGSFPAGASDLLASPLVISSEGETTVRFRTIDGVGNTSAWTGTKSDAILAHAPLAYYQSDATSGTALVDSSGNGRNATIVASTAPPTPAPSWVGGYYDYRGLAQASATIPSIQTASGTKTTVAFNMYWRGGSNQRLVSFGSGLSLYLSGGAIGFNTSASGDVYGASSSGLANRWVHVVATFNSGDPCSTGSEIYIDGVQMSLSQMVGTCAAAGSAQAMTTTGVTLAASASGTNQLDGKLDDVAFVNGALTSAQVSSLYSATSDPVVRLDRTSPATLTVTSDSTANGTNGWRTAGNWTFSLSSAADLPSNGGYNAGTIAAPYAYSTTGATTTTGNLGTGVLFTGTQGIINWTIRACDTLSNCTANITKTTKVDTVAPTVPATVTRTCTGNQGTGFTSDGKLNSGWCKIGGNSVLTASGSTDATSGVVSQTSSTVTTEANTAVAMTATDAAGNVSAAVTGYHRLDKVAPAVAANAYCTVGGNNGWCRGAAYSSSCSGGTSGLSAAVSNCNIGATGLGETGGWNFVVSATDGAGNAASATSATVKNDYTAPAVAANAYCTGYGVFGANGWCVGAAYSSSCSDNLSGIVSPSNCNIGATGLGETGGWNFGVSATDAAGNSASTVSATVKNDYTAPVHGTPKVVAIGTGTSPGHVGPQIYKGAIDTWYNFSMGVTVSKSNTVGYTAWRVNIAKGGGEADNLSGINLTYVNFCLSGALSCGNQDTGAGLKTLQLANTTAGTYKVVEYLIDNAGNKSATLSSPNAITVTN